MNAQASTRSLPASTIHALATLPEATRNTLKALQAMGYSLAHAYAIAVRARQA